MTLRTVVTSRPAVRVLARLRAWPVASQQRARRNAMVAATRCAQRRVEREDVASFLSERYGSSPADAMTGTATATATATATGAATEASAEHAAPVEPARHAARG